MPALVKKHSRPEGFLWLIFFVITIVLIGCFFCLFFYLPIYVLSFIFPRLRAITDWILRFGIGILMRVQPWYAADVHLDLPRSPDGRGRLLVSNHRSHLDVFVLLSRVQGIRILARKSLMKIPGLGFMMRATRQIGVERGRFDAWVRAMDEVKKRLAQGETVHVFPEMTRCPPGFQGLQPFTSGPFLAALQEKAMVVPVVFRGTDRVWPKGFVGLNFREKISVEALAPLRAEDFANVDLLKRETCRRIEAAL